MLRLRVGERMARARGGGLAAWAVAVAAAWVLWAAAVAGARSPAGRVHQHLKRLNKPAVKSIEVGGGYSSVKLEMIALSFELCADEFWKKWLQTGVPLQIDGLVFAGR